MFVAIIIALFLLLFATGERGPSQEELGESLKGIPTSLLTRIAKATAEADSAKLRALAQELDALGHKAAAVQVRAAADQIDRMKEIPNVSAPPPGAKPAPTPVIVAPPGAVPISPPKPQPKPRPPKVVTSPGQPIPGQKPKLPSVPAIPIEIPKAIEPILTTMPIDIPRPGTGPGIPVVPAPPPGARPAPVVSDTRVPDPSSTAGKIALMLYDSSPRGPVKDVAALGAWKKSVGVKGAAKLYGPGTAKSLIVRGIVPPTPWDWPPSDVAGSKKRYRNELLFMARTDKVRAEEWTQAAEAVK